MLIFLLTPFKGIFVLCKTSVNSLPSFIFFETPCYSGERRGWDPMDQEVMIDAYRLPPLIIRFPCLKVQKKVGHYLESSSDVQPLDTMLY